MDCPICYEPTTPSTHNCTLSCSHTFHLKCMTTWMQNAETCPMCRLDISGSVAPTKRHPWEEYGSHIADQVAFCRLKNMNGKMISEQMIHWLRTACQVSRGMAIRALQYCEEGDEESAFGICEYEKEELIFSILTPEPKWNEPTEEMNASWGLQWLFNETRPDPNLSVQQLKARHNFAGFYDWKNHEWESEITDLIESKNKTIY